MRKIGSFPLMLTFIYTLSACTDKASFCGDEYALNYSDGAGSNEGCQYPLVELQPDLQTTLSDEVRETSGLAWIEGHLLTHNDSNHENKLYVINPTSGRVSGRIRVKGAENIDWEDLAQNEEYLFIADMGNNRGNRRDLKLYKIKKSKLQFEGESEVEADEVISFRYPEQQNFSREDDHNFDSEALIYYDNFLYLFTKNRGDQNSSLYRIPAQAGSYDAELIDTFRTMGKITGAAINAQNKVALIGYNKNADCFIWVLEDYSGDNFFSGKKTRIRLGSFRAIGQTEALIFTGPGRLLISSEKVDDLPPRLYALTLP